MKKLLLVSVLAAASVAFGRNIRRPQSEISTYQGAGSVAADLPAGNLQNSEQDIQNEQHLLDAIRSSTENQIQGAGVYSLADEQAFDNYMLGEEQAVYNITTSLKAKAPVKAEVRIPAAEDNARLGLRSKLSR